MEFGHMQTYKIKQMGLDVWQFWKQDKHLTETSC